MNARLDQQRHYGDLAGGVSDPRLVRKVDLLSPQGPLRPDQIAATEKVIDTFARDTQDRETLRAMILPETFDGRYALPDSEEAL